MTFYFDGGFQTTSISYSNSIPGYTVSGVPPGPTSALVTASGLMPTYFPGLQISPGGGQLDLNAAVASSFTNSPPAFGVLPSQLVWVGQALTCVDSTIGGFTVALSPAAAFLGYYDTGSLSPTLTTSAATPGGGEFVAFGAPYAQTDYVLALPDNTFLHGTFTPPAFDGSPIAVALIYPNFSHSL